MNRQKVDKSDILNGDIFIEDPLIILEHDYLEHNFRDIMNKFIVHFEYKKVVNALTGIEQGLGCSLILNEKSPEEFLLKGVCRGGRFDDILRGMLLYPEFDKNTL